MRETLENIASRGEYDAQDSTEIKTMVDIINPKELERSR